MRIDERRMTKREAAGGEFGCPMVSGALVLLLLSAAVIFPVRAEPFSEVKKKSPPPAVTTGPVDLTILQCGNLIYADNQSSVCFADRFLSDVAKDTNLRVTKTFCMVKLSSDTVFDYPFCVMSGNETFALTPAERENLKKYLTHGGFILASPGCSDDVWDKAFRKELRLCFPDAPLAKIPADHAIFSTVHAIPRLTEKHGKAVSLEGLELNGRLVLVYSKEGLNDVANAKGCCCCGGNEITDPAKVNVNIFTYAVLY